MQCVRGIGVFVKKLLALQGGVCFYCSCALTLNKSTFDHLLPVSHGGPDNDYNVVVSCMDCNDSFSNSSFHLKII